MIHHHHDNTGVFGAMYSVLGYFMGIATDYIPSPEHWYSSILPAALAAVVGWTVTKICNYLWKSAQPFIKRIK